MTLPLPTNPTRLVFIGTPEMAVPTLDGLVEAGFDVVLVVTRPDVRRGRGGAIAASPVKEAALRLGLPVTHIVDDAVDVNADLAVVVAFGQLIKTRVLQSIPMVNLHFSLLPRWRGAAPVERAILAGDDVTGVCVMDVVDELDAGDVFARAQVPIDSTSTLESLRRDLVRLGTEVLIAGLRDGFGPPVQQVGETTYAHKLTSDDVHLDWLEPAAILDRRIRVGGAWTTFRGKRLKVWQAELLPGHTVGGAPGSLKVREADDRGGGPIAITVDGGLELITVQPEGKPRMDASAWANGARIDADDRLGS